MKKPVQTETKKQEILIRLKKEGRLSTSRVAGMIGVNILYVKKYLAELEKEGSIKKEDETNACYWKLR